jgi:hypothetical protein
MSRPRSVTLQRMPRAGTTVRARAIAWWQRNHADPEKRAFRRIGLVSFGVVGASVILAKLTQDTAVGGVIRALAITLFGLATVALLGVVILMGEEVVDEMDASDPMRARRGGAYGPRIKRFFRDAGILSRAWVTSRPARIVALRHAITRDSLTRFAVASVDALGGVPPAGVHPPRGAGRLARMNAPPPQEEGTPDEAAEQESRRALTASELLERSSSTAPARRRSEARVSRAWRRTRRSERAAQRGTRTSNAGDRSAR